MRGLLLAEKPSVMRAIQDVYNKEKGKFGDVLDFGAFHGHLMALKDPEDYDAKWSDWQDSAILPMIPVVFAYKAEDKTSVNKLLAKINSGNYDYLINACDAGREGEHIFWSFYETVGLKLPVKRFWASSTTHQALKKALYNLRPSSDYAGMRQAAKYRAQFDWLVGMNFTRAASFKLYRFVPIGRVQSPVLKLIVDREREIQNFQSTDFYEVKGNFKIQSSEPIEFIHLIAPDHKNTRFDSKLAAEQIANEVKRIGNGAVLAVKEVEKATEAPTLYSLTELQKDANKYFKFKPDKTLSIAQKLYEAGFLTYPRTESRFLPTNMVSEIPEHIRVLTAVPELKRFALGIGQAEIDAMVKKEYVDDAGITDHHAIIPTDVAPNWSNLSKEEQQIYTLVGKSFLAIFMEPYKAALTSLLVTVGNHLFLTKGKREIDKGYTVLYPAITSKDVILPSCKKGDPIAVDSINITKGSTQPPKRYTPSSLLAAMEKAGADIPDSELRKVLRESAGLGTPATRADILNKLEERELVKVNKNAYYALDKGMSIIDNIGSRNFCSALLTAEWEKKLQEIEKNQYNGDFRSEMEEYIKNETVYLLANLQTQNSRNVIGKCPICGGNFYEGNKSYYCENKKKDGSGSCNAWIPKIIGGYSITDEDLAELLNGNPTEKHTVLTKKQTKWDVQFVLGGEKGFDILSDNQGQNRTVVGKCPICGNEVYAAANNYYCAKGDFSFPKKVKGTIIDESNMLLMLKGEQTEPLKFKWKNGHYGYACLYLDKDVLKWLFMDSDYS